MPVLLMDIRTQVRGVPHYDCAEMVFKSSEAFALEFTPNNPKDKNSILARLTYGDSIVGHVAAEACVEIATLRREYSTTTLLISAVTLGPAKFGRKGLHVSIREKQIGGSGGSLETPGPLLEPPGPLLTHLHTVYTVF